MTIGRIDCVNHLEVDRCDMFDIFSNRLNFSAKNGKIVLLRRMDNNLLKRRVCFFVIDVTFFNEQTYQRKANLYIELRNTARCSVDNVTVIFKIICAFLKKKFRLLRIVRHTYTYPCIWS